MRTFHIAGPQVPDEGAGIKLDRGVTADPAC